MRKGNRDNWITDESREIKRVNRKLRAQVFQLPDRQVELRLFHKPSQVALV